MVGPSMSHLLFTRPSLQDLVPCGGAAVLTRDLCLCEGKTPGAAAIRSLACTLIQQVGGRVKSRVQGLGPCARWHPCSYSRWVVRM